MTTFEKLSNECASLREQLKEVHRDIDCMLSIKQTEKTKKMLADAREYRNSLEEDLARAYEKCNECKKSADDDVRVIGVVIINLD